MVSLLANDKGPAGRHRDRAVAPSMLEFAAFTTINDDLMNAPVTITENDGGTQVFVDPAGIALEHGSHIAPLELAFETYGKLSSTKDNVILVHHALSTNAHLASHNKNEQSGWWESVVGPGKTIDTNQYFVICINNLGSCFGSTGPASLDSEGKPYRKGFPEITASDIVKSQVRLLNHLGINSLFAVIGNSMGAMLSLQLVVDYPDMAKYLVSVSSCYKAYAVNSANRMIQRNIIQRDPAWQQGDYERNPTQGFIVARKLSLLSYRHPTELNQRFEVGNRPERDINCYLNYNAEKFVSQFDANSYLTLMSVMDHFDVTSGYGHPLDAFRPIKARVLVISVDTDLLFSPQQQQELFSYLQQAEVEATLIKHHSIYGHDTFLIETDIIGNYIQEFLG